MSEPIVLVVRRGAQRRFESLKHKTSRLQVEVVWDRREYARRTNANAPAAERRKAERRQPDSFTWKTADFVVALPTRPAR